MKVLLRILIILLAAAVVVGATYVVTQVPAVQTLISSQGGEQHGPPAGMSQDAEAAQSTQTRPQRGDGGHSGGNLAGLVEVGKNFAIVLVVSLAVAAAGFAARRLHPRRSVRAAAA